MAAESSPLLKAGACGVLVALTLVAAGAILDMKAAHEDSLELVMMAVRQDGRALEWAGDFKDNKAVVLAAVQQFGAAVRFASERLKGDKEVALRAARHSQGIFGEGLVLKHLRKHFEDDSEVHLAAVRHNPNELKESPLVMKDRTEVLDLVRQNGLLWPYLDDKLKKDREVVLAAVRQKGNVLRILHKEDPTSKLLKDREVVLEAVRRHGAVLESVSKAEKSNPSDVPLTKDREVVLAAVRQHGLALQWADPVLQKDPAVVMAAVVDWGTALQFAEGEQKEAEIAAVFRDSGAIPEASPEVQRKDIVSDTAGIWQTDRTCSERKKEINNVMSFFGQEDDSERKKVQYKMELAAVRDHGTCLTEFEHLQNNKAVVDAAVRKNGMALRYVKPELQEDRKVVLAAVRQNGMALEISQLKDKEVVLAAVQQDGLALQHAGSFLNNPDYREVVLEAVRQNGKALKYAHALKSDREVVLAAVRHDRPIPAQASKYQNTDGYVHSQALQYADEKLRKDRDVVLEALRSNGRALEFVKVTEMTATWERTITTGVIVLVLCIVVVVRLVFTPHEASSDSAGPSE